MIKKVKENQEIVALMLMSALGVLAGSLLAPVEAIFVDRLTDNEILLGAVFSVGAAFSFIFSVILGRWGRSLSRKKMMLIGLIVGMFFPLIYATSLNAFQYMFGKAVRAFVNVSSGVMIASLFHDLIAKKKNIAEISAYRSSINSIFGTVGAFLGGYLADTYGLVFPYYAVIIIYVLSFLVFIFFVYAKTEDIASSASYEKVGIINTFRKIINNPFLFLRIFTEGLTQSNWAMEPIVFPIIIYALTKKMFVTGLAFGATGIIAMIFLPIAGRYVDRTSPVKGLKITFIFFFISFLILYFAKNIFLFVLGMLLLSVGKSFNRPSCDKIEVENVESENRVEYLSYIKIYDTLTGVIACLVVGMLMKYYSPHTVLLFFAVFTALGGGIGFYLFEKKRARSQNLEY